MTKGFFITGTDTDVGKTWIARGLLKLINDTGYSTTVMKPISAGCEKTHEGYRNDDAVQLINSASVKPAYEKVNPYAYGPAIAPHIAAEQENTVIELSRIITIYNELSSKADYTIVEGAGGWKVPINNEQTLADIACAMQLPVIIVVGMRLGCLNHAILTAESIFGMGVPVAGWVANTLNREFSAQNDNIDALQCSLNIPFIGTVPFLETFDAQRIAENLNPGDYLL